MNRIEKAKELLQNSFREAGVMNEDVLMEVGTAVDLMMLAAAELVRSEMIAGHFDDAIASRINLMNATNRMKARG